MRKIFLVLALLVCGPAMAQWSYDKSTDRMSDEQRVMATLESKNKLTLGFPYQDPDNRASITIMQSGKGSTKVLFGVWKGQMDISSCLIQVRFDEEKPAYWKCSATSGNDAAFITDASRFIAKLKTAKKVMVQVLLYRMNGDIMEFDVAGLKWPWPQP